MKHLNTGVLIALLFVTAYASLARAGDQPQAHLCVAATAQPGGDGSQKAPFRRITDAVQAARWTRQADPACEVTIVIHVAPGRYTGSLASADPAIEELPILLDVPGLVLRGSNELAVDGSGLPTGSIAPETEAVLAPDTPLPSDAGLLILGLRGMALHDVTVMKLTLDGGHAPGPQAKMGAGIVVDRTNGFSIRENCFRGVAIGIDLRASAGKIQGNYMNRLNLGAALIAGNAASPADVLFAANRAVDNRNGAVALEGGLERGFAYRGLAPLPPGTVFDSISAVVSENDLSENRGVPLFSFGIRIFPIGQAPIDAPNPRRGAVRARIEGNRLVGNEFGVVVDAGFPDRSPAVAYTGTLDLAFDNNEVTGNVRAPALFSFTRSTATTTPANLNRFEYLQNALFDIRYGVELDGWWFDHPELDPVDGQWLGNTLRVNGSEVPNGRYVPLQ
jgi:hypothetical protein